jgi:hypothetical protein
MTTHSYFTHLNQVEQTYSQHFTDSIGYSWKSFKASFCFLCHAVWPDVFITSGSSYIMQLNDTIQAKYDAMRQNNSHNEYTLVETTVIQMA